MRNGLVAIRKSRHLAIVVGLVAVLTGAVASPAAADVSKVICGSTVHAGVMDIQACIELDPGATVNIVTVTNKVNAVQSNITVTVWKKVGTGSYIQCYWNYLNYAPYQSRTFYCYGGRVANQAYRTRGLVESNSPAYAYSPTVTG
jgi:hypothetical protein